ncbi:MAG: S8 family serine peptidase, partial [Gammaproteobacteria bacterium]|nr:S8 family serine peptidase [Gammaproteobacteria bacterium]
YDDGVALKAWLDTGSGHVGRIGGAFSDLQPINGDVQAGFSSRGPNSSAQNNLKPDVTNPGVDVLAAVHTVGNSTSVGIDEYGSLSGTSMSSPHTAGAYALLKAKRPELSPSEAQSAFMMTSTRTLTRDSNGTDFGDPFDRGAGRVDLTQAARAALVMHEDDYGLSPADAKALNIPSFADSNCQSSCFWMREVKSASTETVTWNADYSSEDGVIVSVTPSSFTLNPGETRMITVTADIAAAVHATPQGLPGPGVENESIELDADGNVEFTACNGNAGDNKDCWVFADVILTPSTTVRGAVEIPSVSMPLAARSTGDSDGDGLKDLVDNCPTFNSTDADQTDSDNDGVGDVCDNCLSLENPSQCDTNSDGYGNHCDADLNNDDIVNSFDLSIMRQNFGQSGDNDSDLNCDGIVNSFDLSIMRQNFGGAPGPSALVP